MSITRIKRNQITDLEVIASKLAENAVTASKLDLDLIYPSNLTITGNLTVQGATTVIDTTNTVVADPLIVLARNQSGAPSLDSGIVIERGSDTNVAFAWDESNDRFMATFTTETGTTAGTINKSGYADLIVGNLTASNFSANIGNVASGQVVYGTTGGALKSETDFTYNETTNTLTVAGNVTVGNIRVGADSINTSGTNIDLTVSTNGGNIATASRINVTNAAASSSTTTGALVVAGGVGIGEKLYVSANLVVGGTDIINAINTVSNAVSVVSAQVATNSAQMVSADNAISNAVSVVSAAQLSTWNAVSNEISARQAASADLKSAINAVSDAVSVVSAAAASVESHVNTVSNAVSVVSAQVATNSAQMVSADNAISNAVSVVSAAQLSTWNRVSAIMTSSQTFSGATYTFNQTTAATNTSSGAVVVAGGVGIGGALYVSANSQFTNNVNILGNLIVTGSYTIIGSNNTAYTDNIIELHTPATLSALSADDGKDIGIHIHYFKGSDQHAFLGWDNSSGYLEWQDSGAEGIDTFTGNYGTMRLGNLIANASTAATSTTSGAITTNGGIGVVGNAYIGGNLVVGSTNIIDALSALSNYASVASAAIVSVESHVNTVSNAVSVVSAAQLSTYNALSNEISARQAASADLQSAINTVSNAVSVVSAQVATNSAQMSSADAALSVRIDNISNSVSVTSADLASAKSNLQSAINVVSNATSVVSAAQLSTWNRVSAILTSSTTFSGATYTFSGSTASTNTVTGAVVITGGLGVGGNINAANISIVGNTIATTNSNGNLVLQPNGTGATVVNDSGAASNFVVKGDTDTALIFANATNDNIGLGTATPNTGAKLHINATNSVILPKGTTAERPGIGVVTSGMVRFNTSSLQLEFYDGTSWQGTGSTFTVIADDKFTGDGSTTIFTLSSSQTTNSCIVSINGIVQIPTDAYGVTGGTTLTFTEPPAFGDIIDVREITTTTTVTNLTSNNGYVVVETLNTTGVVFSTGTSSVVERWRIDTSGNYLPSANASYSIGNATSIVSTLWVNEIDSGNIIPRANAIHSLGNVTNQWKDLYLAGNTMYLANVAITSDGSVVTIPNLTVSGSLVMGSVDIVSAINAVSARLDTVSNQVSVTSADLVSAKNNLQSAINVVSNAVSVEIANRVSAVNAVSNAVSVVSAQVATNSAQMVSADNAISAAVNVVSNRISAIMTSSQSFTGALYQFGNIAPSANITYDSGSTTARWLNVWATTFNGTATTAQYADLAEKYLADAKYDPGTVMVFGGAAEITQANTDSDRRVAGVVSDKPAYLMNSELEGQYVTDLALLGRVPCKVIGPIQKGDMLIVAGNGHARSEANPVTGSVIGKALQNFEGTSGVIEIVVGRM